MQKRHLIHLLPYGSSEVIVSSPAIQPVSNLRELTSAIVFKPKKSYGVDKIAAQFLLTPVELLTG